MSDYIDRESAIKAMLTRYWDGKETLREIMNSVPAADVAPVRRGKPILKRGLARCSECDGQTSLVWPYCPHCGAKMETDEE